MNRDFMLDALERAVKTFAQTLLAYFGAGAMDILHADWGNALSLGLGAAVLSVLSSLLSLKLGNGGTASATDAVVTATYADAIARGRTATGLMEGPA